MDKVFIKDLEVETIIGIFGWEREVKQKVRISMEMSFDISKAGKSDEINDCLLYTSPSPRDLSTSRMPSSA